MKIVCVAIPSNRVNVSYAIPYRIYEVKEVNYVSQSPQIGSMFLTCVIFKARKKADFAYHVAIPSNRVNVSYTSRKGATEMGFV